jgi:hypothetical protein
MEPIGCPETSVHRFYSTLHNIPEERRSYLHRGGNLKLRTFGIVCQTPTYTDYVNLQIFFKESEV